MLPTPLKISFSVLSRWQVRKPSLFLASAPWSWPKFSCSKTEFRSWHLIPAVHARLATISKGEVWRKVGIHLIQLLIYDAKTDDGSYSCKVNQRLYVIYQLLLFYLRWFLTDLKILKKSFFLQFLIQNTYAFLTHTFTCLVTNKIFSMQ